MSRCVRSLRWSWGWTGVSDAPVTNGTPGLLLPLDDPERTISILRPRLFQDQVVELFHSHFHRLVRYLGRLSGDPELASDLVQEAFVKLHRRGALPDHPEAWLITVAMNLFRNARSTAARRRRLLTPSRAEVSLGDPAPGPARLLEGGDAAERVRAAIDRLGERDRQLLLLRAEGYGYRELAAALGLNEASVGTLLARAKRAFREVYEGSDDAP